MCWVGESMEYGVWALLCSGSLAFLLEADDKRDDKGHGGNLLLVERTSRSGNADGQSRAESKDWDESTTTVDGGTYKKRTHCQHSNRARVVEVQPGQPGLLGLSRYSMAVS